MNDVLVKNLVLVGGGHAHVHVIKMFGMKPLKSIQITLITRDVDTPYSGMLPGYVAGHYTKKECHIDLCKLCRFANVRLIHAEVTSIDVINKMIQCHDGRPPLRYDILSIDIGITPKSLPTNFIFHENITPVKPIDRFGRRWDDILNRILSTDYLNNLTKPIKFVIVGGGAGGVELCFAMNHRIKKELILAGYGESVVRFHLITRGNSVMSSHNP